MSDLPKCVWCGADKGKPCVIVMDHAHSVRLAQVHPALAVPCGLCNAPAGKICRTRWEGRKLARPHRVRLDYHYLKNKWDGEQG